MSSMKIGVIGCGKISPAYFNASKTFRMLQVIACADVNAERAKARAAENNVKAMSVEKLMADKNIQAIINLTVPDAHAAIDIMALEAGKHVYSEKPLGIDIEEGQKIIVLAAKKKLRVGCAPDTFLGAGGQTCRKIIDDGWIGRPVAGTVCMLGQGPENWHPNPGFFYHRGAGPMLDIGPYYITTLINLLGPVKTVFAATAQAFKERVASSPECFGQKLPVKVPTHYTGILEFHNGAIITLVISFDIKGGHDHNPIEIYGTEGSLIVPDPNTFGGPVKLKRMNQDWKEMPLTHSYEKNFRSIGLADMVCNIAAGKSHRCNPAVAFHVLEVMLSFEESSKTGQRVEIKSMCKQPAPLPAGLPEGMLD